MLHIFHFLLPILDLYFYSAPPISTQPLKNAEFLTGFASSLSEITKSRQKYNVVLSDISPEAALVVAIEQG
jgi:chromosome condensin MukBEF MukE localization factor